MQLPALVLQPPLASESLVHLAWYSQAEGGLGLIRFVTATGKQARFLDAYASQAECEGLTGFMIAVGKQMRYIDGC
jgi:hypothetical protein